MTILFICFFSCIVALLPAGNGAIMSQFRVWPFPRTIIVTLGERNRNPGHRFAGVQDTMLIKP